MNIKKTWMKTIVSVMLGATIGVTSLGFGFTGQASAATPKAEEVLTTGKTYLGIPYRFGAPSGVTYAFDCSSFTQYIFEENGIALPRTSKEQSTLGTKVDKGYLSKGDLVFFSSDSSSTVAHVAIYAGNNKILHASTSSGVTISSLDSTYWSKNYITARRVIK
ncbi:cell wall-associated NlpC family hydrolase [Paenibacillus cellulosilyticus]|uniref:Cell wall-associated NlpC family hydrolase n=1 Tax=Paenibacillus cellulosilyticus TaxID=375489 RepID=A0A2V2YRI9_9BACL|nr:C40 family peptidase [Paenibacillus cellulosilyticus]PWW00708.1 cell wall-associated NlpC family hydrolase [Paenibacillus cellulosilyticus]QKS45566.1 C40 family peptidase [Paenibacillus cellulosilyticus]